MKIYQVITFYSSKMDHTIYDHVLGSFAYQNDVYTTLPALKEGTDVIIDSGAFTMWSKQTPVDIWEYIKFCEKIKGEFGSKFGSLKFVNLDIIPGQKGKVPTKEDREYAAEQGLRNLDTFVNYFDVDEVIHVFHMYEDFNFLDRILDYITYIGISPANDAVLAAKRKWLRRVFHYLPKGVKTHGFAVTGLKEMREFPWYSVDSATANICSGNGTIMTPWGYVSLSTRYDKKNKESKRKANDIRGMPYHMKEGVRQWLEGYGWTLEDVANSMYIRRYINILFFKEIEKELNSKDDEHHNRNYINPQYELDF